MSRLLVIAAVMAAVLGRMTMAARAEKMQNRLWVWGHPAGVYNRSFLRPVKLTSTIEPVDGAERLGLKNMIFVRYEGKPAAPYDSYYAPFRNLDRVYWSLVGAAGATSQADRDAAFSLAEKNENIVGFILDDFFHETSVGNAADVLPLKPGERADQPFRASLTPDQLHVLGQRQVRGRKLPIMAVIYTGQVKAGAKAHIAEVDELCLWTWRPADLENLEANLTALEKLAPGKPIYLGCYTYDFNACRPLPVSLMQHQVDLGYQWLTAHRVAGMIFLATPNFDVGFEAVEWTRQWVRAHGEEGLGIRDWGLVPRPSGCGFLSLRRSPFAPVPHSWSLAPSPFLLRGIVSRATMRDNFSLILMER